MRWVALTLLVCVAAGPTTQPRASTTQPAGALQAKLADAQTAVVKAREAAIARCRTTSEYQALAADRQTKEEALETARLSGSPQDRLDASSTFVKADQAVKRMEAEAVTNDKEWKDGKAKEAVAEAQLRAANEEQRELQARAAKAAQDAKDNDPTAVAIREGRLTVGMDESQAKEAIRKSLRARYPSPSTAVQLEPYVTNEDGVRIVTFECTAFSLTPGSPVGRQIVRSARCEFDGGKLVHFSDKWLNVGE